MLRLHQIRTNNVIQWKGLEIIGSTIVLLFMEKFKYTNSDIFLYFEYLCTHFSEALTREAFSSFLILELQVFFNLTCI
ncbi:hypothetical protein CNEO4_370012 [Clostridium neonatale]|nr:hypothetical protein CNEO4_370012 [Clostridium neonatale]